MNIVFFDGVCNFCDSFILFVVKNSSSDKLKFASLQSNYAREYLPHKISSNMDSIVFFEKSSGKIYLKSKAVFKILKNMNSPFRVLLIFKILPTIALDLIYDIFARHRYSVFGKKSSCSIPDKNIINRFLS